MTATDQRARVRLDLNNPIFQENLLTLRKPERHSVLEALNKLRQTTWAQAFRNNGMKCEKIVSATPPQGATALYSLRISQARRATAYRDGDFIRFLTIAPDHDSTYGKR